MGKKRTIQQSDDAEILKHKGIVSPDISEMKYRYYDPATKMTLFFASEAKFKKFKRTLITKQTGETQS